MSLDPLRDVPGGETVFVMEQGSVPYRLLRTLYFLRALGTRQVHRLFYPGLEAGRVYRQLKLLAGHGFLERAGRLYEGVNPKEEGKGQLVWLLGQRGYRVLREEGLPSVRVTSAWIRPLGRKGRHVLGLNDIYLRVVESCPRLRPFEWVTYPRGHVYYQAGRDGVFGSARVYPDAVVTWEGGRVYVEYDRGTETLGRIGEKIEALRSSVLAQSPGAVVICACEGRIRAGNVGHLIRERGLEGRMTACEVLGAHQILAALIGEAEERREQEWLKLLGRG